MNYFSAVFKKYAQFSGRSRRAEYWYFALFNFIILIILIIIGRIISLPIFGLYWLAAIIPSIAVAVRRMHDVDKSGWFLLIPIYSLILLFTAGTPGPNQYGDDPKGGIGFGATDYQKPFDINNPA